MTDPTQPTAFPAATLGRAEYNQDSDAAAMREICEDARALQARVFARFGCGAKVEIAFYTVGGEVTRPYKALRALGCPRLSMPSITGEHVWSKLEEYGANHIEVCAHIENAVERAAALAEERASAPAADGTVGK